MIDMGWLMALRHERIEAWILEQAGVVFDAKTGPEKLRVVAQQYFLRYYDGNPILQRPARPSTAYPMD